METWASGPWRGFRRLPLLLQIVAWIVGWWLLLPLFTWSTGAWGLVKWRVTAVCALLALFVGIGIVSPPQPKATPTPTARAASQQAGVTQARSTRTSNPWPPVTVAAAVATAATATEQPARIPPSVSSPSQTVVRATATPAPVTQQPQAATATQNPNSPAAVAAYKKALNDESGAIGPSLGRFSDLMAAPKLGDSAWTIQVAGELGLWQAAYGQAQNLNPPPCMAATQEKWLAAVKALNDTSDSIAQGVDNLDAARLRTGLDQINQGKELTAQATTLLNGAFC